MSNETLEEAKRLNSERTKGEWCVQYSVMREPGEKIMKHSKKRGLYDLAGY